MLMSISIHVYAYDWTLAKVGAAETRRAFSLIAGTHSPFNDLGGSEAAELLSQNLLILRPGPDGVLVETGNERRADDRPLPLAVVLLGCDAPPADFTPDDEMRSTIALAPLVFLCSKQRLRKARGAMMEFESENLNKKRQVSVWFDLSEPDWPLVHDVWPADLAVEERPGQPVKASALDLPGIEMLTSPGSGLYAELQLDVKWAGGKAVRSSFAPRRPAGAQQADRDAPKREKIKNFFESWTAAADNRIVITEAHTDRAGLHEDLTELSDSQRVFWREGTPPVSVIETIAAFPPELLAVTERQIQTLARAPLRKDVKHEEEEKSTSENLAREGLRQLVQGQLSSLHLLRPVETKSAENITRRAQIEIEAFENALKSGTFEKLKFRDASKTIVAHLGPESRMVNKRQMSLFEDVWEQIKAQRWQSTFPMELSNKEGEGKAEIETRIHEIMEGLCLAHAHLILIYWARFIRPYITEQVELFAGHPEDVPVIPAFAPNPDGFSEKNKDRIKQMLSYPPPVETSSLWSLKPLASGIKRLVRKLPMILAGVGGALAVLGTPAEVVDSKWLFVLGVLFVVAYAWSLYQSNRNEQKMKLESYMSGVEKAVSAKLGELVSGWFEYLKAERLSFMKDVENQIILQTSGSVQDAQEIHAEIRKQLEAEKTALEDSMTGHSDDMKAAEKAGDDAIKDLLKTVKAIAKPYNKRV